MDQLLVGLSVKIQLCITILCDYCNFVGADYNSKNYTVEIPASRRSVVSVNVSVIDDNVFEGNENFTLTLTVPTGILVGEPGQITVVIIDDDRE